MGLAQRLAVGVVLQVREFVVMVDCVSYQMGVEKVLLQKVGLKTTDIYAIPLSVQVNI